MADRGSRYDVFNPTIWADYVRHDFMMNLVAAPFFKDFTDNVSGGGDTIRIPYVATVATQALTTSTGVITEQVVSDTRTTLAINTWVASAVRFTDYQLAQVAAKYNLQAEYVKELAYGVSKIFDTCLLQTAVNGLSNRVTGATNSVLTATNLRNALQIIDSYSVPRNECAFIVTPTNYWQLMRNSSIYSASEYGRGAPMAEGHGAFDMIFGLPTIMTQNIPAIGGAGVKSNMVVHKRAVSFALGNITGMSKAGPRVQLLPKSSEGLYRKLIGDLMFGVKLLDGTVGVKLVKLQTAS